MRHAGVLAVLVAVAIPFGGASRGQAPLGPAALLRGSVDIQKLIDQAAPGSTVEVPYAEHLLPEGLVIKGKRDVRLTCPPGTRILVGNTDASVISVTESTGIQIDGFHLRHRTPLEEYRCHGAVVEIAGSQQVRIRNCELNGCGAIGVSAKKASAVSVRRCFVHHNTFTAFYLSDCDDVTIESCVVEDNGTSLQVHGHADLEMRDNLIRRNGGFARGYPDPNPGLEGERGAMP